jgi:hypothetical protein
MRIISESRQALDLFRIASAIVAAMSSESTILARRTRPARLPLSDGGVGRSWSAQARRLGIFTHALPDASAEQLLDTRQS